VLFGLGVAVPAVYRFISARLKWDFCLLTALGAGSRIHLAGTSIAAVAAAATPSPKTLGSSGRTARRTTLGLIGISFGSEEFLFFGCKGESFSAIGTREGFLSVSHC